MDFLKDLAVTAAQVAVGVWVGGATMNFGKSLPVVGPFFNYCRNGFDV